MANILVYIELHGNRPAAASLEALGEGRRIATFLGATLYAVLPSSTVPNYGDDDAIAVLSRHGADKVILADGPEPDLPALYATHGRTIASATERVPPSLVLVAATAGGRDLAPRVAAKLGAAFVAEPAVEYGSRGELVFSRLVCGGTIRRRLAAEDVERPIVATLTAGSYAFATGDEEAEVIVVKGGDTGVIGSVEELSRVVDPGAALDTARVVVTAGAGVGEAAFPLVRELATALGGEVGLTRGAVERGLGTIDFEIGIGGRHVAPRLYLACGASGSAAHLAGISSDTQIIAINRDPAAPIFRVASYGIVGEVGEVVAQLLAALAKPGQAAAAS